MKAFISLAVAPEACEYRFFPLLYFLTEGSQILWVTKPLHSEGCHSLFSPWLPSLCSPLYIMNTYPGWVYEGSLWGQAWWMLCDSASKRILWWEHLSCSPLLRLQHFVMSLFPALHAVLPYSPSQGSRTWIPLVVVPLTLHHRADHCHTQRTNPFIVFYVRVCLWTPNLYLSFTSDWSAFTIPLSMSSIIAAFASHSQ